MRDGARKGVFNVLSGGKLEMAVDVVLSSGSVVQGVFYVKSSGVC
jgi:hypothetical protein